MAVYASYAPKNDKSLDYGASSVKGGTLYKGVQQKKISTPAPGYKATTVAATPKKTSSSKSSQSKSNSSKSSNKSSSKPVTSPYMSLPPASNPAYDFGQSTVPGMSPIETQPTGLLSSIKNMFITPVHAEGPGSNVRSTPTRMTAPTVSGNGYASKTNTSLGNQIFNPNEARNWQGFGPGRWLGLPEFGLIDQLTGNYGGVNAATGQRQGLTLNAPYNDPNYKTIKPTDTTVPQTKDTLSGAKDILGGTTGNLLSDLFGTGTSSSLTGSSTTNGLGTMDSLYADMLSANNKSTKNQQRALENQYNLYNDQIAQQEQTLNNQLTNARTDLGNQTDQAVQQTYEDANNTQRANRNVLRALGILGSSAAGEMLSKPLQQADKAASQLRTQYTSQMANLQSQYADLLGKIKADQRFQGQAKIDAIKQLQDAAKQTALGIQQSAIQYAQALQQQKQQTIVSLISAASQNSPATAQKYVQDLLSRQR